MRILWRAFVWSVRLRQKSHHWIGAKTTPCIGYLRQNYSELLRFCAFQSQYFCAIPEMLESNVDVELYSPNPEVRGMTVLNRSAFKRTITVPAFTVKKDIIHRFMKSLKNKVLRRPGLKRVVDYPKEEDKKLVLLDPCKISCRESLEKDELLLLEELDINPQIIKYDLELSYEHFKTEEILRAVLPEGQDVTSGFSRIGHIAHMNLREHQLPYKNLIGQVVMDKNPGVTSVVNKTNTIDTTYRNFQMEILAGDNNMITKVRENNISYEFDFSKVYWNPRLSTEHERITGLLKSGDILFDVFAGVGPFAIPAAKKNCTVFANDLNPESYNWLLRNCKLNKVDKKVQTFNMDGRDFINGTVKEQLAQQLVLPPEERKNSVHIVMNLPGLAVEFLDAFKGLLDEQPSKNVILPTVHCYSFSKDDNPASDIRRRAEAFMGTSIEECSSIHLVRNVAPNKEMMCISFRIPARVLYKNYSATPESTAEPSSKRLRRDEESNENTSN